MEPLRDCDPPDTSTLLQRIWDVMSDSDCAQQEERLIILLNAFFSVSVGRIKLKDLHLLTEIMNAIEKRSAVKSKYYQYFEKILNLLKAPIRMEKPSDQLVYQRYIVQCFTTIGYILLRNRNTEVKRQLLEIILMVLMMEHVGDSDLIPISCCIKAFELSDLTECLADLIAICDEDLCYLTVFITLEICQISKLCCWTLLMKEVIETVLVRLTTCHSEATTDMLLELLWTLLRCTDRSEDWEKVPQPSRIALRSLRYVLREQALTHCHPGKDRELLFNIAALTLKLIHLFPNADFVLSGLMEDITVSATLSESVLEIHIMPFFRNKAEHLHFKKLMLACVAASPINSLSLEIFKRFKLAECLVVMLRLESSRSKISWCSTSLYSFASDKSTPTGNSEPVWFNFEQEQSIDLFRCAIPVVCALFDSLHNRFIKAGLISTLTCFLRTYYVEEKNEVDELFSMVVKTIFFVCFSKKNPEMVKNAFIKAHTATILVELCNSVISMDFSLTLRMQSILGNILHVLSNLIEKDLSLPPVHIGSSFKIIQLLYHRIIKPLPTDSVIDNCLTVAVSNFAWAVLTLGEQHLLGFLTSGELYSHLDILEMSDSPAQLVCLSMLVDIAEHYKSVPYLVSWRGKGGVKLLSVLCNIWRKEEIRFNVPRSKNGCITDTERPLMGEEQYKMSKGDIENYVSVCDVLGSCRPKIYALVQLLHRHDEVTKLCEEHYKLGHDVLPWKDQVTLQLIEAYFPLKLGEVWWEIFIKQEDALPLDRYLAQTLADRYLNWSLSVQKAQLAVLQQREAALEREEQQYYMQVRSVRLTAALEALRHVTAIARTADHQLLLAAHRGLRKGIEESRPPAAHDLDLHVAFPEDVRVLVVNPAANVVVERS